MNTSGAKLSTAEYAARKLIDVAAAIAVPVATFGSAYVLYFHGHDIANSIKKKFKKTK